MEKIKKIIKEMDFEKQITLEDIPDIELYIDQVIQLFEKTFNTYKRNEEDKVLTKTMINNYAKGKIFLPIKNKKYSKEHVILISLIFQLKGGLTLNDIKATLKGINEKTMEGEIDLEHFYESYLQLFADNARQFSEEADSRVIAANREAERFANESSEYLKKVLYISSFITMSNFYRRMAEKLVDEIEEEDTNDLEKKK